MHICMTDSDKLDLIISKLANMDKNFESINKRLNKLDVGRAEISKELYMIERRISDTYKVALDALAISTENGVMLENSGLKV